MRTDPRDLSFWAIDPGDVHVGLAEFRGGVCTAASETRPHDLEDRLMSACQGEGGPHGVVNNGVGYPRLLVVERFALRGDLMAQQQGSEFLTSQLIGSLRFICRHHRVPVVIQTPHQASLTGKRAPWSGWRQRGWRSYGHGGHAKMAEQHGYFYIQERLRELDPAEMNRWLNSLIQPPQD